MSANAKLRRRQPQTPNNHALLGQNRVESSAWFEIPALGIPRPTQADQKPRLVTERNEGNEDSATSSLPLLSSVNTRLGGSSFISM